VKRITFAQVFCVARPLWGEALTALAAILGMIPLAGSLFWGPMAITIMGGLFVATMLTLLVVPALYALWFRVRADEPASTGQPESLDQPAWEEAPFGIAAE
jgi:AcrB/AcrD/AcrF family